MIKTFIVSWILLLIVIFAGSLMILDFEAESNISTIKTYEDSLWWSINVSSAVGDCELYPVTRNGRIISTIMMIVGYAVFSITIGMISSFFREEISKLERKNK